ncbi:MAG: hypothetical protein HY682_05040 [Chloroflexi bacterium]|nr:hypothetical protein [Chloroflexota bacterium]
MFQVSLSGVVLSCSQMIAISTCRGIALHLRHDSNAIAARARAGLLAKFERMADPNGTLTPEARVARAKLQLRQHMSRLALKSLKKGDGRRPGAS